MGYNLEIVIPTEFEIRVFLRGTDSSIFDQGRRLEELLIKLLPALEIRCANFETRGNKTFYEIKVKCLSREVEKVGKQIKEVTNGF